MKKLNVALVLLVATVICGTTAWGADSAKAKLSVFNNQSQIAQGVLEAITDDFRKANPNIEVDFQSYGKDYESMMKIKMASNDLPDVFSTHGWAVARYDEYLADLSKEAWASRVQGSIRDVITDKSGKLCVLPMDLDITGMTYNKDIFKQYGLKVPTNFKELLAVCEAIKTKSGGKITPLHYGGGDSWPIGGYYDFNSTAYYVSSPAHNYSAQLLDGSFDWTKYDEISKNLLLLKDKQYLNKDILTAKYTDSVEALAKGTAAIGGCYGAYIITEIKKINPDFHAGMMPIPAYYDGDKPTFIGGERTTWGVWKDSKYVAAAKKYVAFFAQPQNLKKVSEANGIPAGLDGVVSNLGDLTEDYTTYKTAKIYPYFDRALLPNGMWDVMCKNGQDLLAGGITPRDFSDNMKKEYLRLRNAK
jgi:raffinose/stachyose/melibiose transport system substrate-binding protein